MLSPEEITFTLTDETPEVLRFDFPHNYYVDLSDRLLGIKTEMLGAAHNS